MSYQTGGGIHPPTKSFGILPGAHNARPNRIAVTDKPTSDKDAGLVRYHVESVMARDDDGGAC